MPRGRPRKTIIASVAPAIPRRRGRPRKTIIATTIPAAIPIIPRRRGRPRKTEGAGILTGLWNLPVTKRIRKVVI